LLLLGLHLLHHRSAAADDLPHPHLKGKRAVLGEARRRRTGAERQLLRHCEAIFPAFLHPAHGFGEAGEDLVHGEWLRTLVALAAVDHRAVVGGEDIIEQGCIGTPDRRALARLDRAELKPALSHLRAEGPGADPGKPDTRGDDEEEAKPQRDRPAAMGGAMGGFGDGHFAVSAKA